MDGDEVYVSPDPRAVTNRAVRAARPSDRPASRRRIIAASVLLAAAVGVAVVLGDRGLPEAGRSNETASATTWTSASPAPITPARSRAPSRRTVWRVYGRGAGAVAVVGPAAPAGPVPVVVFLHGWGYQSANNYRAWIRHLARRGNAVIVPRYQTSANADPAGVRGEMLRGVRIALRHIEALPRTLVVAGHSAGAALAVDYAAVARSHGLPRPRAVYAVYPGRAIRGTAGIPAADLARISPDTRLRVLAGARDTVVGQGPARQLVEAAIAVPSWRRRIVRVSRPEVADHLAPLRSSSAARTTFWRRLDRLIDAVRSG